VSSLLKFFPQLRDLFFEIFAEGVTVETPLKPKTSYYWSVKSPVDEEEAANALRNST
jgi:hypothetical protein